MLSTAMDQDIDTVDLPGVGIGCIFYGRVTHISTDHSVYETRCRLYCQLVVRSTNATAGGYNEGQGYQGGYRYAPRLRT